MDCSAVCKRSNLHTANQRVPLWTVCWYALSPLDPQHCHTSPLPLLYTQCVGMRYLHVALNIVILFHIHTYTCDMRYLLLILNIIILLLCIGMLYLLFILGIVTLLLIILTYSMSVCTIF